jgi:hypothetical protein
MACAAASAHYWTALPTKRTNCGCGRCRWRRTIASSLRTGVIQVSLTNLMTFPWIGERVATGKLELHGTLFDIRTGFDIRVGVLMMLGADGKFIPAGSGSDDRRGPI